MNVIDVVSNKKYATTVSMYKYFMKFDVKSYE